METPDAATLAAKAAAEFARDSAFNYQIATQDLLKKTPFASQYIYHKPQQQNCGEIRLQQTTEMVNHSRHHQD
jgi:hypothetical protein